MLFKQKEKKPTFEQQQRSALKEIGSILQQTRKQKNLSLTLIAEQTCISKRLLKAIENGNIDLLPPGIYTQGFIRRFAQTLGLDGIELSGRFPLESANEFLKNRPWWKAPVLQLKTFHLYIFYILIVVLSVKSLSTTFERALLQGNEVSFLSHETVNKNQTEPSGKNGAQTDENLSVKIQLQDQSWLEVVVDGKTEFKGELPKGTNRTWNAKQELTLRTGNAGGVLVALNDQQAQQLGQPGQVQEVTYKAPTPKQF